MEPKIINLFGWLVRVGLSWVGSVKRKLFPWCTVFSGLLRQFIFALVILKTRLGLEIFAFAQRSLNCKKTFGPVGDLIE